MEIPKWEMDADGFWPAASGRDPYRPATSLSADEWNARAADARNAMFATSDEITPESIVQAAQTPEIAGHDRNVDPRVSVTCRACGASFARQRSTGRYCSDLCRKRAQRAKVTA